MLKEIPILLTEYVYKSCVILTKVIVFLYNINRLVMGMFSVELETKF
jgi:uncharacterized membrane protein YuzA (DUF378 family)